VVAEAVSGVDTRSARPALADLRVAIAHDWLVQYAGSERVVEAMLDLLPQAQLLTTIVRPDRLPPLLSTAQPSFLDRIPGARRHHELFLPLMPLSWRLRSPLADLDVVISSSHACAKAIRVDPAIPHICYCHTPMRYAWDFASEAERFPRGLRSSSRLAMAAFRRWDRDISDRVDVFVANSSAVAGRIKQFYGRDALVVHPPVRTNFFTYDPAVEREDFFLFVGRFVAYKKADALIDAFAALPHHRLVVVGGGPQLSRIRARAAANVTFAGNVSDVELRELYRRTRGFVYPADEDFGIAMAEAQSCGAPILGLAAGGACDIVEDGSDGVLIPAPTTVRIREGVDKLAQCDWDHERIGRRGRRFSGERFRRELRRIVGEVVASSIARNADAVGA